MAIIQILYSIIIGLVQGIAEWLPISSKTQVMVASTYLLHLTFQQAYTFGLFMEIGTILAAIIYFRKELLSLLNVVMMKGSAQEKNLFTYVLTATVATGIVGVPLYFVADSLTNMPIGIPMILIGLVLIGDALLIWHSKKTVQAQANRRKFNDLSMKDYLIIGIVQGIAALPGVSRSGITTSTMLLMNVEPDEAFRLSFLVGIFAAIAAFGLTIVASHGNVVAAISQIGVFGVIIAMVTATLVSIYLIDFLIKVAGRSRIVYLAAALGIIAIASGLLIFFYGSLNLPLVG